MFVVVVCGLYVYALDTLPTTIIFTLVAELTPIIFTYTTGLLKVGVPQTWDKSKKNLKYVREAGVRQFISTYNRVKDLKGDELVWGDEIEYGIFILDHENKKVRISLRAKEVSYFAEDSRK